MPQNTSSHSVFSGNGSASVRSTLLPTKESSGSLSADSDDEHWEDIPRAYHDTYQQLEDAALSAGSSNLHNTVRSPMKLDKGKRRNMRPSLTVKLTNSERGRMPATASDPMLMTSAARMEDTSGDEQYWSGSSGYEDVKTDTESIPSPSETSFTFSMSDIHPTTRSASLASVTTSSTGAVIIRKHTVENLDAYPFPKVRKTIPHVSVRTEDVHSPVRATSPMAPASAFGRPAACNTGSSPSMPIPAMFVTSAPGTSPPTLPVTSDVSSHPILSSDIIPIAHDKGVQRLMDQYNLAWGTQYEIARGVSSGLWTWESVTLSKIQQLTGSNAESAIMVPSMILGQEHTRALEPSERKLWEELDREQQALIDNNDRGLGLQGDWMQETNWYGGRIQQIARLVETKDKAMPFKLQLDRMEMKKSHRFARFLGSRHMMRFSLPKNFDAEDFLLKKFVLCGRIFIPICVKDGGVYMMETDENFERQPQPSQGDQHRISFQSMIDWYNPLQLNGGQSINKWVARFDLGLSISIPTLKFGPENIVLIPDQYAPHTSNGKIPQSKIYTDGCGWMNGAALAAIAKQIGYTERPTALQGRILGSKGVWILHPSDWSLDEAPRIWIRDSQVKIKLVSEFTPFTLGQLHPAHLIFDLVQPSKVSIPSRLNKSIVMNLSHNGVPAEVFIKLMEKTLEEELQPFMKWTGPNAMLLLWNAVNKNGHVSSSRLQRRAAGFSRALGLARRTFDLDYKDPLIEDEDNEEDVLTPEPNQSNEKPDALAEAVVESLQAGFSPISNMILYDDLRKIIKQVMESFIKEYHVIVSQSAEAFIVPDPYGVLEEGQIHFKACQHLKDPLESYEPDVLDSEVLIYRNPTRLPSDVQKVKAIHHPRLSNYKDVIVLPIKGPYSLAGLLAGGDVDGDTAVCIFDQSLVQSFKPGPIVEMAENFLAENFESQDSILKVASLLQQMNAQSSAAADLELRKHLHTGFSNIKIGIYSKFHENAVYALGYDHSDTIHNAFMFNEILDSRKSGLLVRDEVFKKDKRQFDFDPPPCMSDGNENIFNNPNCIRRRIPGLFILDELLKAGKIIQDQYLKAYDDTRGGSGQNGQDYDRDLLGPYQDAMAAANNGEGYLPLQAELKIVKKFVDDLYNQWRGIWAKSPLKRPSGVYKRALQKKKIKADVKKEVQILIKLFAERPSGVFMLAQLHQLDAIKASYAYTVSSKFAFDVAFKTLCNIKALAKGSIGFTRAFAEAMSMPSSTIRVLKSAAVRV